jgi:uncharacterized membrane protein
MNRCTAYFRHHARFYSAAAAGVAALGLGRALGWPAPLLAGGDVFFLVFLFLALLLTRETPQELARRADSNDEGIVIVFLITVAAMAFFSEAVFVAINKKHGLDLTVLLLAGLGAPLGWFVLHTVMAFHYANLHYFDDPETTDDDTRDLKFPGCVEPGPWDFLYFSFVVGMTAQVSDVQVKTTVMRRAALGHGVVSFFFNTVFIAMAVNAAVAMAN